MIVTDGTHHAPEKTRHADDAAPLEARNIAPEAETVAC